MGQEEVQKICLEKNILLDNSLSQVFSSFEDFALVNILLEKIKILSGKRLITDNLMRRNGREIKKFLEEISLKEEFNKEEVFEKLNFSLEEKNLIKPSESNSTEGAKVKVLSSFVIPGKKIEVKDFVTHFRNRYNDFKDIMQEKSGLENPISINKIPSEKQKFSIIGMVYSKRVTKNKNVMLEIEDLTGKMKVLINSNKEELLKESEDIALDSVLGFKGVGNEDIMFVNEIFFPEVSLPKRKKGDFEECAAFIGDFHYGSKNFLEKDFLKFVDYLNGKFPDSPESSKIKYLFIIGDLVTGIGNYPNQEGDLLIKNLEEQFEGVANLLSKIRKDIKIIISPGNHDCVRLMEPQPLLDERYAWPLYDLENVIITENPAMINIGETKDFEGFDILTYHGFSFPYYANNIPKLMLEKTMNQPEKIMKYLLKNRHLAPSHTSTQYFPLEKDALMIRKIPDIFLSGHTHKSGVVHHNNVLIISSSSWEGKTDYQEKFGNEPDHCKVILFNLKSRAVKVLDFETLEGENDN